jgi:hypothetical protein
VEKCPHGRQTVRHWSSFVDSIDSTHLIVSPVTQSGIATQVIALPGGSYGSVWTASPLPVEATRSNGLPLAVPTDLYNEQVS